MPSSLNVGMLPFSDEDNMQYALFIMKMIQKEAASRAQHSSYIVDNSKFTTSKTKQTKSHHSLKSTRLN